MKKPVGSVKNEGTPTPLLVHGPAQVPSPGSRLCQHDLDLIYEALRFYVWGAGEGLSPVAGEPAEEPESTLGEYSQKTGNEDWDGIPDVIMARLKESNK